MSILDDIMALIVDVPSYEGYAPTGAEMPYVCTRPLLIDSLEQSINGTPIDWDYQFSVYCAAAGVTASFNLAVYVIGALQGKPVGGTTLSATMGYVGALVEGHYETQVTVQLNQGGI